MIPIFESGPGKGIGYGLEAFLERFDEIWQEHLRDGTAKAFAFVFYDFTDHATKKILEDQGVYAKLDRLSGKHLSLFYLHAGTRRGIERFNETLMNTLGIFGKAKTPCVAFFKISNSRIEDISVVQLEHQDLIHGFNELSEIVRQYISDDLSEQRYAPKAIRYLRTSFNFISIEVLRAWIRSAIA